MNSGFDQFIHFRRSVWKETGTRYISATEAKQRLAALLDAAQREPVTIRRQKRDVAVLLSAQEYERLRGLNIGEFEIFCDAIGERAKARGLDEAKLVRLLENRQED